MLSQNVPDFCIHRNRSHANIGHPNLWIIFCSFPICLENLQFISSQTSWKVHHCTALILYFNIGHRDGARHFLAKAKKQKKTGQFVDKLVVSLQFYSISGLNGRKNTISLFIQSVLWTCLQNFMIQWPDHSFYKLDYDFFQRS